MYFFKYLFLIMGSTRNRWYSDYFSREQFLLNVAISLKKGKFSTLDSNVELLTLWSKS